MTCFNIEIFIRMIFLIIKLEYVYIYINFMNNIKYIVECYLQILYFNYDI